MPTVCLFNARSSHSLAAACMNLHVSASLSLKTVHWTVFAFGTLAFESLLARNHRNNESEVPFFEGTSDSLLVRQQGLEPRTDRL